MDLKLFVAVKALIERDGKVLVLRESAEHPTNTHAGEYDLPGGRIEPGEHLEDALLREVKEETGLDIEIGAPFFADESLPRPVVHGKELQVIKIFFFCKLSADAYEVTLSDENDEFAWIDPREYKKAGLIENLYPVFETYLKTGNRP
jgi:8-oxo-dGTP diphosphatase